MYFTDILNNINQIQYQMGKFALDERHGFHGDFPAVQIYTDADHVIVSAEIPGLAQDELQLSITDDVLSISGEIKRTPPGDSNDESTANFKFFRQERKAGKFQKIIELPYPVDGNQTEAVLKNGILSITFPLKEEAKPRQISIKTDSADNE
jgi:HSP20 family protein